MKVFDSYSKYYDLLYREKDYESEAKYIELLIKKFKPGSKTVLDLGCGTGRHDLIFAERGYDVTGVELSKKMHKIAEQKQRENGVKNLKFICSNIKDIKLGLKYDVIVSLFHVLSYQTSNEDIGMMLAAVKEHLKPGGIFLFDFWYGPAVLITKPERRMKVFKDKEVTVRRQAAPVMRVSENLVEVNYKVDVKQNDSGKTSEIKETHKMRYFFIPEIKLFLNNNKMKLLKCEEWMTRKSPTEKSWSVLGIAGNE